MKTSLSKKLGVLLTLATLTFSTLALPNRANAAIGFATFNPILGFIGLGVSVVGGSIGITGMAVRDAGSVWSGLGIFLLGILLLDEEKGTVSFQQIGSETASRVGLTSDEWQSYNQEVEKINLLNDTVTETLSQDKDATVEKAAALWTKFRAELSPLTNSALAKIMKTNVKAQ